MKQKCNNCDFWVACNNCNKKFSKIDQELKSEYTLQNSNNAK